jgi:ethanolamine ammonia-lyase large subunit
MSDAKFFAIPGEIGLFRCDYLRALMARASSPQSHDELAGIVAGCEEDRVATRMALADFPHAEIPSRACLGLLNPSR